MGSWRRALAPIAGITLWLLVAVALRRSLEASMLRHALIQLPLLAVSGALLSARRGLFPPNPLALPALLVALFTGAIWMLPRMLDASLENGHMELAKVITIPLLVGCPLGWSWRRLNGLTRAFVWANLVSMLLILGWLYKAAPVRVCNYYLLEEQQLLGNALLVIAVAVALAWLPTLFLGSPRGPKDSSFSEQKEEL